MSRRIYEMECRREEQARQAHQARVFADKAATSARHVIADDVPQPVQDVLMGSSEREHTAFGKAVDAALVPFHAAISKPAQKAYLGTFLLVATSLLLLGISTIAYTLFYYNFVPQIGVERVIHLQFGDGHPYGVASLSSSLTSLQAYDITLFLHLPRTPNNIEVGNFMLDLSLLSPPLASASDTLLSSLTPLNNHTQVLAHSRRSAILTYVSPILDTANTLSGLPWYLIGWKRESDVLEVKMFEGVEFAKGWRNVPQEVKVVVEADMKMQFYEMGVKIVARFKGLRWILYHHRILSYLFFTTAFWTSSMTTALIAWLILSFFMSPSSTAPKSEPQRNRSIIKTEPSDSDQFDPFSTEDLSDTSRTFPTLGRQPPLHFAGRNEPMKKEEAAARVKKEEQEEVLGSAAIDPLHNEADDEEDDEERDTTGWRDSGIGTSLEEGDRRESVQRRRRALFGGHN